VLIGRHREREQLEAVVESVRGGMSQALVLWGGAGIGKTTLLEHLVEAASDLQVIHLVGIESEMRLTYAALHRLLGHHIDIDVVLPVPQARALRSAFGLDDGTTNALMVGLGALTSLANLAVDTPVVCIVDDAQWLDEESAAALAVAARRVNAEHLAMVFALRSDDAPVGQLEGLPQLHVPPLPPHDAYEILAATGRRFDAGLGARIVDEAEGNPLALGEFAREVPAEPLAGPSDLLDPLPLGARLEEGFHRQVRAQPRGTQLLLLTLAADSHADEFLVQRVGVELGFGLDDAAPAYATELLSTKLTFRHPLIRSAVYQGAAPEDRRRVHATLATMIRGERDADRCAWHRAAAVIGKDDAVASELEEAAARARAKGGFAAAGAFLVRAAQLTPDPSRRAALLLAAAEEHLASGAVTRAEALIGEAAPSLINPDHRARAKVVETSLTLYRHPERYAAAILDAVHALGPIDRHAARARLLDGLRYGIYAGRFSVDANIVDLARAVASLPLPDAAEPSVGDALLEGMAAWYLADHRRAASVLAPALAELESDPQAGEVIAWLAAGCNAAIAVADSGALSRISRRFHGVAVAAGAWNDVQESLHFLVTAAIIDGALDEADALLTELDGIRLAQGLRAPVGKQLEVLAWRGSETELRTRAAVICGDGGANGRGLEVTMTESALAVLELSLGNYAAALASWPADWQHASIGTSTLLVADFAEAAVRGGDEAGARSALERYAYGPRADGAPSLPGLLARAHALLAGHDDGAEELYLDSIAQLDELGARGHLARSRLVYGEWLLRRKRRRDACQQLRVAYEAFETMGSPLFAERARVELNAAGEKVRTRSVDAATNLTPQEVQVARRAADGMTNAEIGTEMFISPATVDYHLRKVYRKLGIAGRRELVRAAQLQN
jgi:DNA-binding CsgD family transcriptional regulator